MNLIACSTGPLFFPSTVCGMEGGGGRLFNLCLSRGSQLWVNPASRRLNEKWGRSQTCQTSRNCGKFWRQTPHLVTCKISYNWGELEMRWILINYLQPTWMTTVYKLQNRKERKKKTSLSCFVLHPQLCCNNSHTGEKKKKRNCSGVVENRKCSQCSASAALHEL